MSKKGGKKGAADEAAEAASAEAAALLSPRTERQRVWAARLEDAVAALQHVQQRIQHHNSAVESTKQQLDQTVSLATLLWTLSVDELPAQYREKSRPTSQRAGSVAGGRGGSPADQRPSSKQSPRNATGAGDSGEAPSPAAGAQAPPETVEGVIRQLPPAQRSKTSSALQALFYAQPSPPSAAAAAAGTMTTTIIVSPVAPTSPSGGFPAAGASAAAPADGDAAVPSDATRRGYAIPPVLLNAMKELQCRRVQLESQLAAATSSAAQQQQRSQLLEEESLIAHYALEALRKEGAVAAAPVQPQQ